MKPHCVTLGLILALGGFGAALAAQPVVAVIHVDIAPPIPAGAPADVAGKLRSDANALGRSLVLEWASYCKRELGCERIGVLMQIGSLNHFTLLETFANAESQANFESLPQVRSVRERIQPVLGGPLDQRLSNRIN